MNQNSTVGALDDVVIRRPLSTVWMTVPHRRERLSEDSDEWAVVLSVEVYPGVSTYARFTCTGVTALRVSRDGRAQRRFIYYAVMTPDGPATKIDKIEIDSVPYTLRQ